MMMKLRQNKKLRIRWLHIIFTIALIFVIFSRFFSNIISPAAMVVMSPVFKKAADIKEWQKKYSFLLKEKEDLNNENAALKEKNSELEARIFFYDILSRENQELKSILGRTEQKQYILAALIARPPQVPYDILIIDAGSEDGVQKEMEVKGSAGIFLGRIEDVFKKISKVKLISFPGNETNIYFEGLNIFATAVGTGNGNLEIKLPVSLPIKEYDKIISAGVFPLLLGSVEKIEKDESEGTQKIMFRLPVNLQEIRYLLINK